MFYASCRNGFKKKTVSGCLAVKCLTKRKDKRCLDNVKFTAVCTSIGYVAFIISNKRSIQEEKPKLQHTQRLLPSAIDSHHLKLHLRAYRKCRLCMLVIVSPDPNDEFFTVYGNDFDRTENVIANRLRCEDIPMTSSFYIRYRLLNLLKLP